MTCNIAGPSPAYDDERREFLLRLADAIGRSLANEDNERELINPISTSEVDASSD
jgi:hypothetical protein